MQTLKDNEEIAALLEEQNELLSSIARSSFSISLGMAILVVALILFIAMNL